MTDLGTTISQSHAAAAYGRTDGLGVSIPVRSIDPTRQRFQVKDQVATGQTDDQTPATTADSDQTGTGETTARGRSANGFGAGLLGAFTSFLARFFGQQGDGEESQPAATSAMQAGIAAYDRAASAPAIDGGVEVMSPSFPRLASGRALDLTI